MSWFHRLPTGASFTTSSTTNWLPVKYAESRAAYRKIIAGLIAQGAEAIILGCTEIMLLVSQDDSAVPLFDTTTIHAIAAVDRALASWQA